MTTTAAIPQKVTHVGIDLGVGHVIRPDRGTHVFVQWQGVPMARRQHVDEVEAYVEPAPVSVRRRRRTR